MELAKLSNRGWTVPEFFTEMRPNALYIVSCHEEF